MFSEENSGKILVKIEKINNSEEYAEISVNVVPEFGTTAILVLIASIIGVIFASRYFGRKRETTNKNNLTGILQQ